MKQLLRLQLIAVLLLLWAVPAQASTVDCYPATLTKVQYAVDCEKSLTATQDFLNTDPTTVNSEMFFGYTDWAFLKKDDPAGNGQTGTWSLTNNEWLTYANIMLIFKDGNGTTLLGYLLGSPNTSGTWSSPFSMPEFNVCNQNQPDCTTIKNVSHISYYARGVAPPGGGDPPPPSVPEPSPLLLMMMGMAGLFCVRRFRSI